MAEARSGLGRVLAASGVIGFVLGVAHVEWQWAVEHAQVLSGVVAYPPDRPTTTLLAGPWSLLNQILALALGAGATEGALSWVLSGLLGSVSCQAIATLVFAISGRAMLSIAGLFVVMASRATDWGPSYPIALFGTGHTYGVAGLSLGALAIGLAGCGALRSSAWIVGLLPAVHASLGAFLWIVVGFAWAVIALTDRARAREIARAAYAPLAFALALVVSSYLFARMLAPPALPAGEDPAAYLRAFLEHWDGHRRPVAAFDPSVRIALGLSLVSIVSFRLDRARAPESLRVMWLVAAVSGLLGFIAILATQIDPARQPAWMIAIMPGRLLNIALMLAAPVLFGLSVVQPGRAGVIAPALLATGLLFSRKSAVWTELFGYSAEGSKPGFDQLTILGVGAVALVILSAVRRAQAAGGNASAPSGPIGRVILAGLGLIGALTVAVPAAREFGARRHHLTDWRSSPVFASATGPGTVLTGGNAWLIPLRTRSAILVDIGALDVLPYHPAAAPAVARLLRDIYGVDLMHPPAGILPAGRVPADLNKQTWEGFSRDRWREISQNYGVTRVVTDAGWKLNLRSVGSGHGLDVFVIE